MFKFGRLDLPNSNFLFWGARAHFRARRALAKSAKKVKILNFSKKAFFVWRSARAQVRARTFGGRQCILLIQEILFDYLIAILAKKLVKIESDEILSKIEFLLGKKLIFFENFRNFRK